MTAPLPSPTPEESPDVSWSRPDDRFVPIRACDLIESLAADAQRFGCSEQSIRSFCEALQEVVDRETGAFERRLTDAYARFNPDRETCPLKGSETPSDAEYEVLQGQIAFILDKANYEELDHVQIAQAVMHARSRNLRVRVDPNRVEFLSLWVRGRGEGTKIERSFWRPWRVSEISVPVFKRMVVAARLTDDPHVILKLFKDIPESDVEALLPHAEVTMSWWDRLQLFGTGAGTLGITVTKLMKIAIGFAALWKLAWILLIGLATLGVRAALGYRNARINRNWQRTQHLYFQNLGNNASALQLLVATVKQEEFKEALLAYLFSQIAKDNVDSTNLPKLRTVIEQYLRDRFGVKVDFDIGDAQSKLKRLGLWRGEPAERALSIDEATAALHGICRTSQSEMRILECG